MNTSTRQKSLSCKEYNVHGICCPLIEDVPLIASSSLEWAFDEMCLSQSLRPPCATVKSVLHKVHLANSGPLVETVKHGQFSLAINFYKVLLSASARLFGWWFSVWRTAHSVTTSFGLESRSLCHNFFSCLLTMPYVESRHAPTFFV